MFSFQAHVWQALENDVSDRWLHFHGELGDLSLQLGMTDLNSLSGNLLST